MRCYFIELRTILFFKGILLTYKGKQFFCLDLQVIVMKQIFHDKYEPPPNEN